MLSPDESSPELAALAQQFSESDEEDEGFEEEAGDDEVDEEQVEVQEIMASLDANGDGKLSEDEYCKGGEGDDSAQVLSKEDLEECAQDVARADADKDGSLSAEELLATLSPDESSPELVALAQQFSESDEEDEGFEEAGDDEVDEEQV